MATLENESYRRSRFFKNIQKGYTGAYPKQSSIPYKYRTVVTPESERKGFNSQSKRFYRQPDENPGPGFYNVIHQSPEFNSVSLSKKGTGCFPSVITEYSCKERSNLCIPPQPAFLSNTPREFTPARQILAPSPGHYEINESLVKETPKLLRCGFKSKTLRDKKIDSSGPGPGSYNPESPVKASPKKTPIRKKCTLTFSAFPLPPLPKPPVPGPGQYDIVNYRGPCKHYISSATFVSSTERWTYNTNQGAFPGPTTYKPEFPGKQSFIYNSDKKWIPAL
ncbi:O(6)-methylguanine-induced apoptosis 2 isoform X2 [Antechinus flavipes]|uniref:O(6)-methylguanine-induced apoptosis 2 isoform X2 n=1 Tax=Antechinus flavipes TaxID=38775 RepID=UPI00223590D9|nr:O(6)-methylguanine-induced apoptosis 2 isoform X2 [Antechinus flavipes]